jgi:transcription initiation factor IIE alpha subunit
MPAGPATAEEIAQQMGRDEGQIKAILERMADEGLCKTFTDKDIRYYQGMPFMLGIFEYQFMPGRTMERHKKLLPDSYTPIRRPLMPPRARNRWLFQRPE